MNGLEDKIAVVKVDEFNEGIAKRQIHDSGLD